MARYNSVMKNVGILITINNYLFPIYGYFTSTACVNTYAFMNFSSISFCKAEYIAWTDYRYLYA